MAWSDKSGKKCLLEVAQILDDLYFPFFLMQGTALGAWRDGGFVPEEEDVDFGFLFEHIQSKTIAIVSDLVRNQFQIETWCLPFQQCRTIVAWKYGVHVDIVGFMRWKNKRFTCSPVHPSVIEPYSIVHEAAILETYQTIKVFGRSFQIPLQIETYLEREYGPEWKVPCKDHVSRTRVYDFIQSENIPNDLLPPQC